MKVLIVLAATCIVAASAGRVHYGAGPVLAAAGPALAAVSTGTSSQFRSEDNYGNYNFGYDESHATGSTSRREESSNGVRRGSYSLSDADGRRRVVNYIADEHGFRASVQTNEPGVEPKDPADVLINKEAPVAAVVREVAAPLPAAPVYAAPAVAAPLPAPVPVYAAPAAPLPAAPIAVAAPVKGYGYAAPRLAPVAPVVVEAPAPRAFSYSFGATHLAPAAPVAYGPAPVAAPLPAAPIYQQQQQLAYPQQQLDY